MISSVEVDYSFSKSLLHHIFCINKSGIGQGDIKFSVSKTRAIDGALEIGNVNSLRLDEKQDRRITRCSHRPRVFTTADIQEFQVLPAFPGKMPGCVVPWRCIWWLLAYESLLERYPRGAFGGCLNMTTKANECAPGARRTPVFADYTIIRLSRRFMPAAHLRQPGETIDSNFG
jgi:hypothetical protein